MNDEHVSADSPDPDEGRVGDEPRDGEPTEPLASAREAARGWTPPSGMISGPPPAYPTPIPPQQSTWGPAVPTGPVGAAAAGPHDTAGAGPATSVFAPQPTLALPPPHTHREGRPGGRVPVWTWPAVAVLALVVGLLGGALGSAVYDRVDDRGAGRGLDPEQTRTTPPLEGDNSSVAAVAEELLPSTVQILAGVGGSGGGGEGGATGSGFVLDGEGHIVTNNHVVADVADEEGAIQVLDYEGTRHAATVIGRSSVYDLAILQVEDTSSLRAASLGASEALHVGDPVVAFGAPLGLSQTVTSGIVSALDRPVTTGENDDDSSFINAVQTDAAINPGNSGGPLVNLEGQVVGVNSAIATTGGFMREAGNIGVGFAIPIEQVRTTADQILRTGEARYPVIGATVQTGGANDLDGARIEKVMEGTPAEAAGLRDDDVVTAVEGERVTDGISLIVQIRTHEPGETIEFTVVRDGEERTVSITLDSEVG